MKKLLIAILFLLPAPALAMTSPVFSVSQWPSIAATTRYIPFITYAGVASQTSSVRSDHIIAVAGTVDNLNVSSDYAPTTGKSYAITLYKNDTVTGLSCTISDIATSCNLSSPVTVAANDLLAWEIKPTGTPAVIRISISATFTGASEGETVLGGGTTSSNSATANNFEAFQGSVPLGVGGGAPQTCSILAATGTIDRLYANTFAAPTPGSYNFYAYKNGATTTLSCTISGAGTSCSDTNPAHAVSYIGGDTACIGTEPVSSPTSISPRFSVRWQPATNGQTPLFNRESWNGATADLYESFGDSGLISATEASSTSLVPINFALKNLFVVYAMSSGRTATTTARTGGVSQTLKVELIGGLGIPTSTDMTHQDNPTVGSLWNWWIHLSGSPSAVGLLGAVAFVAPLSAGGGWKGFVDAQWW
jgi:hypothetical protein